MTTPTSTPAPLDYAAVYKLARRWVARLRVHPNDAEDLVQDTMEAVVLADRRGAEIDDLSSYVYRCARICRAKQALKAARRGRDETDAAPVIDAPESEESDPPLYYSPARLEAAVRRLLAPTLAERYRAAVEEHGGVKPAARALGVHPKTVADGIKRLPRMLAEVDRDIQILETVARLESWAEAARELGVHRSVIARTITRLRPVFDAALTFSEI